MEFGYWGIKGRAEAIRLLIAYLGLNIKEWNPANPQEWGARKPSVGPFPNLPFVIDGDVIVTESNAIPTYLIHKAGKTDLLGKNNQDQARVRQIEGVLSDILDSFFKVMGQGPDFAGAIAKTLDANGAVVSKLTQLSTFLGNHDFLLGYLTWADIRFSYCARVITALAVSLNQPNPFPKWANLQALVTRVEALPGIKDRVEASKAIPFFPPNMSPFPIKTQAEL